jgi:beta-galactosidase
MKTPFRINFFTLMFSLCLPVVAMSDEAISADINSMEVNSTEKKLQQIQNLADSGPFKANWDSLAAYKIPDWYQDAKFGIFIHWGVNSVSGSLGEEWTIRKMYDPKGPRKIFNYPVSTYGPQTQFGYKDLIPLLTADKFDAKSWATLFKASGARYVIPVAEHHDGFAMYDSDYTEWKATTMGPKRDVIAALAKSVKAEGLHFGLSSHRAENWWYYGGGREFPSDVQDDRFRRLYGPAASRVDAESGKRYPDKKFLDDWLLRSVEIVDKYQPEIIWFDWWMAEPAFHPNLQTFSAYYYNRGSQWPNNVVINYKKLGGKSYPDTAAVLDIERGGLAGIRELFWQTDTSVSKNSWHFSKNPDYRTVNSLVDDLVDIVSKNGSLLLNIGPRPDGTIPNEEQKILREMGAWLQVNGEAIYGTRPWTIFGEGSTPVSDGTFSNKAEAERKDFLATDIRYTRKGDVLYATLLDWPGDKAIVALRSVTPIALPNGIKEITLLGTNKPLIWTQGEQGLKVTLPEKTSGKHAFVLKISTGAPRIRTSFNDNWHFLKADVVDKNVVNAEQPMFDDKLWRQIRLPHDWAIEGPFDIQHGARTGGLPVVGMGLYRKTFSIPAEVKGQVVTIEFDGAMNNSEVWINGHFLGKRPYGYIGFQYDLSAYLNYGSKNVIAVKLSPEVLSSRWYPGAGLYRNTWLEIKNPVHVAHWGTRITTPVVSKQKADLALNATVNNTSDVEMKVDVVTSIIDPQGQQVAQTTTPLDVKANSNATLSQTLLVKNPALWQLAQPSMHKAITELRYKGKMIDRYETRFGIRSIRYTASDGFFLNDQLVRFNGVCMHHDLGALGTAVNVRAIERQLDIMKSMGVNAIRTSHNPPSPELVQLAEEKGILLLVEAFDEWEIAKVPNGYNKYFKEWHERDLRDMIRRDANSPAVVMWSIGNEILEQTQKDGAILTKKLAEIVRDEDPTRPVTAGFNYYPGPLENGMAEAIDLVGLNYKPRHYSTQKELHPNWILYGSETSSCVSSRGVYHLPIEPYEKHPSKQVTSYDYIGPPWAYSPEIEFESQEKNKTILGEFIWTGFDYLGEPTPYAGRDNETGGSWITDWPARSSYFGAVDLAGFPKDRFFLYQSQWTTKPMVHVLPHWNWQGREGEKIPVYSYTNCDEVELIVNGISQGRKKRGVETTPLFSRYRDLKSVRGFQETIFESKYRLRWDVPYAAGSLKVIGYKDGKVVATQETKTSGAAANISLEADRNVIKADGYDLSFITVRVTDSDDNFHPLADNKIDFDISGPGEIAAVDNGNAATTDPFQASWRRAFNGMALVIVRSKPGQVGDIQLQAASAGLKEQSIVIHAR